MRPESNHSTGYGSKCALDFTSRERLSNRDGAKPSGSANAKYRCH